MPLRSKICNSIQTFYPARSTIGIPYLKTKIEEAGPVLHTSDEQLIRRALNGSKSAWAKLVRRYESAVFHYGLRVTGQRDDAMDLMQDVFVSVYRNLATYRGDGKFKSWLFRIAHHRSIELFRKKRMLHDIDAVAEPVSDEASPERMFALGQNQRQINEVMAKLPVDQREVVTLKFFQQFTFDEIADQTGVSSNTVKSRFYSALDKLRLWIDRHADD